MYRALVVLLSLQLAVWSPAWADMLLTGVGKPPGGAPATPPTVTFIGTFSQTGDPVHTATINIGNPTYIATRRVIVVSAGGFNTGPVVSASINGVSKDVFNILGSSVQVAYFSAVVPTGTTSVTATWTFSSQIFGNDPVAVYIVDNSLLTSATSPVGASSPFSSSPQNQSIVTQAGGFLLGAAWIGGASTPPVVSSSTAGLNNDYSTNADLYASASNTAANASSSATFTWGSGASSGIVTLIAWR